MVSVFICLLLLSFCGWLGFAYFNPNTASGRFLIKVRRRAADRSELFLSLNLPLSTGPGPGGGDRAEPAILRPPYTCDVSSYSPIIVPTLSFLATRISPLQSLPAVLARTECQNCQKSSNSSENILQL